MKNQAGFTLVEMMIVLLVISILLILALPNATNQASNIQTKGCEALVQMVKAQSEAYLIDYGNKPDSVEQLQNTGYLDKDKEYKCPHGSSVEIQNGEVVLSGHPEGDDES